LTIDNFVSPKCLKISAELGHALSQSLLGAMYYEGMGVLIDKIEACKWWKRGAEILYFVCLLYFNIV